MKLPSVSHTLPIEKVLRSRFNKRLNTLSKVVVVDNTVTYGFVLNRLKKVMATNSKVRSLVV